MAGKTESPSAQIDARIQALPDWRGRMLRRVRGLIQKAVPAVVEEWKWGGVPVWALEGILCTGETYKSVVKFTFAKGASLPDPAGLFNSSLEGNTRRAIDLHEGDELGTAAFQALVRAAAALNASKGGRAAAPRARTGAAAQPKKRARETEPKPKLLTGGNPQIAKADGDAPIRAYIAAMPGWKRDVGRRLDALVARLVPQVRRAVKWNSPFYGLEGRGWFLAFHVFARYVKVTFFRGTSLRPVPTGGKGKDARWIDIHEHDLDEARLATWIRQAAALPGWGKA